MDSIQTRRRGEGLSRFGFLRTTGGFAAGAVLAGCGNGNVTPVLPSKTLLTPSAIAADPMSGLSIQLPPPLGSSANFEISTITDFNGLIGRALIDGTGSAGGTTLYYEADLGFVQGNFRSTDGQTTYGSFSFVWIGIFSDAARSNQLHEVNYGNGGVPGKGTGLFWTTAIDDSNVQGSGGGALLQLTNMPIDDAFQIFTSPSVPATLTLNAQFTPGAAANLAMTSLGSTFAFVGSQATVNLSFSVTSQASRTDTTAFAFSTTGSGTTAFGRVGKERNGIFATT